ncbi:MAG TPA: sulfite exporter TauE/SafE family protein [Polyangiales bacterium]|nr:sulfite exporter TauE/SafE family protein [Polyangiales bacterium]
MLSALLAGVAFGIFNLAHCAAMCGPLVAVGCGSSGRTGLLRYQLGRSASYAFAGALAGHFGSGLSLYAGVWASWSFALLTAASCLIAARSLLGAPRLVQLRTGKRRGAVFRTLLRLVPREPLALGLISALLPCGLLAAALLAAVATGSAPAGAAFMFGFAAASGTVVLGSGLLVQLGPRISLASRRVLACALLAIAVLAVARPLAAVNQAPAAAHHSCH